MAKMINLTITNYHVNFNVPAVELRLTDAETGEYMRSYYLSAFRYYRFQVSDDIIGHGDMGSSPVFGLETFGSIQQRGKSNVDTEGASKFLIEAAAMDAITEFMFCYGDRSKMFWHLEKPHYSSWYKRNPDWDKFIDAVYAYATTGKKPENTLKDDGTPIEAAS